MCSINNDTKLKYVAVGRRKTATAKVKLTPGNGNISINNKKGELYFQFNSQYLNSLKAPLTSIGLDEAYDIKVEAKGGGLRGQTDAIKLGVARALCRITDEKRTLLKKDGFLTRDYRSKERKKYGLRKARRAPQFSKR